MRQLPVLAGLCAAIFAASPAHAALYSLETTIPVPAAPTNATGLFTTYDISFFDANTQLYYLADRSNASVDVFSATTDSFVARLPGYQGIQATTSVSGPDGVLVVNAGGLHQLWAGDGNSTITGYAIGGTNTAPTYTKLPGSPISTVLPGQTAAQDKRVDEMAYDPATHTILAANNAATPPFASIINVSATPSLGGQTVFNGTSNTPNAAGGIEQPVYDPKTGTFFVSIPQIGTAATDPGGVSEVNATTGAVIRTISFAALDPTITSCSPAGLAIEASGNLVVGCGNASQTLVLNPSGNGSIVAKLPQTSGADEVWCDPTSAKCFLADRSDPSGPVLGIIDANTNTFLQNIPTDVGDHSVAVDPVSGQVFVPSGAGAACPSGCILVFGPSAVVAAREPATLPILATALLGVFGLVRARSRQGRAD